MIFFAWLVVFAGFVHTQTLNPRSVNVAVETVLEFDGKHNSRDVKAINKLQSYLNRIKKILTNTDDSRRSLPQGFKFRDFLKSALQTVASYDDNDLLDVVTIANNEIRKYHYKGCRFYELVENQNMRRDMAERLVTINDLTAKELRAKLNKAAEAIDADTMTDQKKKMLDYLDSVYVGDDIKNKMEILISQLDQFKKRSKRSNLNLAKVINQGLRSIIFDHYTNLNVNARKELKAKLETVWHDFKKSDRVKDVWRKTHTTKALSVDINNLEIVYPSKKTFQSKSVKKPKRNKIQLELKTDIKKIKRSRNQKKAIPNILLRKKTDRFKKYKKKDKLRTVKPTRVSLVTEHFENEFTLDRSELAAVADSTERVKSRMRSAKNRQKQKKGQRKRQHRYITEAPILMLFKHTRRSNDYDDNSEEGLHIQSFEKHKPSNSLRKSFADYSCSDTTADNVATTTAIPNVMYKINKIEQVLGEIKNLVSLRRRAYETDEENIIKSQPTTAKIIESTSTTTQTTKITEPVTETTTRETTTEESTTESLIVEDIKTKPKTTESTISTESDEKDTKILTETEAKSTQTTPKNETESTFTTKEITSRNPEIESTVRTTLTLDLVSNDTRRSYDENSKDKSRFVRHAKVSELGDLEKDIRNTKRSNYNFNDMVENKLKSIKEHDLTDKERERKYNEYHLNDNLKSFENEKIGKYHEFPDVKRSKEHDFDDFVSDNTKFEKESEFSNIDGMQKRRSNDNFSPFNKGNIKIGKESDSTDIHNHNKQNLNKDFEQDKVKFYKKELWVNKEGHSSNSSKVFDKEKIKIGKDHDLTDVDNHNNKKFNKDFEHDKVKLDKKGQWADIEGHSSKSIKDFAKEKINIGNHYDATDVDNHNKQNSYKDSKHDKVKLDKEGEWADMEVHSSDSFKDLANNPLKFEKDHTFNDALKDYDYDKMTFGKKSGMTDLEHHPKDRFNAFAKDRMEYGTDIERMHKPHLNEFKESGGNNIKSGTKKLTDHDVESMYESHRAMKPKNKGELSDMDIEHLYNETRRANFDKMLDKNSEGDKEINKRVRDKIAGHMETIMGPTAGNTPNKFDFNLDDPFNLNQELEL